MSLGTIACRAAKMGDAENFTVASTGVASFPIGTPTFNADQQYPQIGRTTYSTDNGLGITTTTTPSEAISKIDTWLDTYLLDAPPALTAVSSSGTVEEIIVSWTNPTQKKLAFFTAYVPQISRIRAEVVPTADNGAKDWAASSKWTITLESPTTTPTVTSLRLVLDFSRGTSGLAAGVYRFYGTTTATRIVAQTSYDIRVYAENDATITGGKTPRYLQFEGLATQGPGVPNAPANVTVTSITTTGAFADWNDVTDRDITSDATPYIVQYRVNVTASGSTRFGGVLTNHTTPQSTALTSGADVASQLTLSTLNPGTTYSITVQARNALNSSFGASSSPAVNFTTSLPSAPSWPSTSLTFSNSASLVYPTGATASTLSGTTVSPVVRYSLMTGGTFPQTNTITARLNNTVADTSASVGTITAYAGVTNSETSSSSLTTVGFGGTYATAGALDSDGVRLHVVSDGDAYTSGSAGFYRQASVYAAAIAPATYYTSSDNSYSMYLVFAPTGGSTVTTSRVTFYVDELNTLPTATFAGITSVSTSTSYVTGVPTFTSAAVFAFRTTISNLAHRFLRNDKMHLQAVIQDSTGTARSSTLSVTKTNINGSTYNYYDAPLVSYSVSTTKHNSTGATLSVNPSSIQFNEFTMTLTSASSLFNEALRLSVTPYNLMGTGTTVISSGWTSTSDGSTKPIRIDTVSTSALSAMSGTLMQAGSGQYPTSGFTSAYTDHSTSIASTDQLQMVNGVWATPGLNTGYKDYSGFYFPGSLNQPDYSGISRSGWRYVCVRFQNLKGSGTYDSITLTFTSQGLTLTPSSDSANFQLYVKVVGATTTPWVSATASINPSGYTAISSDGQGAMNNAAASVGSINVFVPTGTIASATVYVRFGLDMSASQSVSAIACTAV